MDEAPTYKVEIETSAVKSLMAIDRPDQVKISAKIQALGIDPRPANAVKLTGVDGWRIRVGNYRVVYVIDDTVRIVTVTRIGHRRNVYERM
jgi:mRNA interferase RelE/StbE